MTHERGVQFPEYLPTASVFIRHVADEWGDRTLGVLHDHRLTYLAAEEESARLARALLAAGVHKGTRIGLLAPNGPDWIVAFLAATRIGAVAVLLNTYWRDRELGWVLDHADIEVLFTVDHHLGHDYVERLESVAPGLHSERQSQIQVDSHPALRAVWIWGGRVPAWAGSVDELLEHADHVDADTLASAEAAVGPDDAILVMYSSGSTSDPKGVVHSHRGVISHPHNLLQFRDLEAGDVAYSPMPLFWVGGLSYTLLSCMHSGATVVFEERFDPPETLALIERERVTHVIGWPHMGKALAEDPTFPDRDLSAVKGGSFGLEQLVPEQERLRDPELRANSLGMTETLGPHSVEPVGTILPPERRGSFGRSVPGVEHRIVDPVTKEDLPTGELGEIWIRGYSLMLGMVKREPADVFEEGGWYNTGDGGYLDADGHLYFKGRLGNVIKSSGMNITPREVELVIEEQPDVMHAFVAAVPHPERGEDVAAAVVARPGREVDADDLRARAKEQMASYKVPRHVAVFATPDDLPWLESGKIDLRALQQILVDRFGATSVSTSTLPE